MSRKEDYVKFWNSYIDYCVSMGSTIFTLEDKIPEGKLIDHSKTKSFGYLKIDLKRYIINELLNIYNNYIIFTDTPLQTVSCYLITHLTISC